MTDWYRPPIRWKPPGIRWRTRRLISGLWLAMLITLHSVQPALALAVQPTPQLAQDEDHLAVTWRDMATAAMAPLLANEPSGTITNTVTVGSTTSDPNPVNNTATQTTTVTSEADLQVSKTDNITAALPGTEITYTIVVTNAGPSAVTNAPFSDPLTAGITSTTWDCEASTGSSCAAASGTDDIATTLDLAVSGLVTFTVIASISPTATGTIANTASVDPPVNTNDPDLTNNDDTDTDILLTGTLTGTVYLDGNGDGSYTAGEGLDGITVVITTSVGYLFTTTTDANGNYSEVVPAGNTVADVVDNELPTGVVQIEGNDPTTVNVPAGGSAGSVDGYEQQGQVTGHIYFDTNGNSVQDGLEPDLPNVSVVITNAFGVAQTVTTDANGDYTATVPVGNTTADVVEATLPAGSIQTEGTDPTSVTATAGNVENIGIDGYQPQGMVDGTVYMDDNGDGVYNPADDTPLPNVTVIITASNGITQAVQTDANGYFSRTVPAGNTIVDVDDTDPDLTADSVLTAGSTDPTTVNVPGGGSATDDTGYVLLASLGDFIWLDLDGNGVQDANEPGLAGVEVELTQPGGGTEVVATGPDGYYTFDDLAPGTYTVTVIVATLPAGVTQTYDPDSTIDHQHSVTIASDAQYEDADFGYQGNASIGDLVWLDSNGNAARNGGEVGLPGVALTLTMENGWAITTSTDASGGYDFAGLISGTYTVTVDADTLPTGAVLTTANEPLVYDLSTGEDYNQADFGYQRQAEIIGHIFEDTNGNGIQDGTEPNLPNVTVVLTDSLGMTQSVTTDGNGNYTATVTVNSAIAPTDTVAVDVDEATLPTGVVQTAGTDPDLVEVTAGTTTDAGDDGYQIQGVIELTVYEDVNQNGSYDDGTDVPLNGVAVVITDSNGVTYSVTTDANGFFSQTVPAGNTLVDVDDGAVAAINPNLMIENGFTDPDSDIVPGGGVGSVQFPYVEPLTIDKDTLTSVVIAGEQVTYTIVVRNIGGMALTNVSVADTLPVSFTYASHTVAATNAVRTATSEPTLGDTVPTWGTWRIDPGGELTLTFVADVASDVAAGTYDNTATADSDQTAVIDDEGTIAQDDNTPLGGDPETDEDVQVVTQADLAVTKLDDPDPVVAGGTLTYTIQIINNGPSDAQDVVVSDNLSADTTFVSASPGCTEAAGVVTCNLGTVPNGAVVNLTIVVTVIPDLIAYGGDGIYLALAAPTAADATVASQEEVGQPGATGAPMAATPLAGESPILPQPSTFNGGGGGGPGSPTVDSGLTAAPASVDSLLASGDGTALYHTAVQNRLGLSAAMALSRDGPPDIGR